MAALEKDYEAKIKAIEEKRDALIANADKKALSIVATRRIPRAP